MRECYWESRGDIPQNTNKTGVNLLCPIKGVDVSDIDVSREKISHRISV